MRIRNSNLVAMLAAKASERGETFVPRPMAQEVVMIPQGWDYVETGTAAVTSNKPHLAYAGKLADPFALPRQRAPRDLMARSVNLPRWAEHIEKVNALLDAEGFCPRLDSVIEHCDEGILRGVQMLFGLGTNPDSIYKSAEIVLFYDSKNNTTVLADFLTRLTDAYNTALAEAVDEGRIPPTRVDSAREMVCCVHPWYAVEILYRAGFTNRNMPMPNLRYQWVWDGRKAPAPIVSDFDVDPKFVYNKRFGPMLKRMFDGLKLERITFCSVDAEGKEVRTTTSWRSLDSIFVGSYTKDVPSGSPKNLKSWLLQMIADAVTALAEGKPMGNGVYFSVSPYVSMVKTEYITKKTPFRDNGEICLDDNGDIIYEVEKLVEQKPVDRPIFSYSTYLVLPLGNSESGKQLGRFYVPIPGWLLDDSKTFDSLGVLPITEIMEKLEQGICRYFFHLTVKKTGDMDGRPIMYVSVPMYSTYYKCQLEQFKPLETEAWNCPFRNVLLDSTFEEGSTVVAFMRPPINGVYNTGSTYLITPTGKSYWIPASLSRDPEVSSYIPSLLNVVAAVASDIQHEMFKFEILPNLDRDIIPYEPDEYALVYSGAYGERDINVLQINPRKVDGDAVYDYHSPWILGRMQNDMTVSRTAIYDYDTFKKNGHRNEIVTTPIEDVLVMRDFVKDPCTIVFIGTRNDAVKVATALGARLYVNTSVNLEAVQPSKVFIHRVKDNNPNAWFNHAVGVVVLTDSVEKDFILAVQEARAVAEYGVSKPIHAKWPRTESGEVDVVALREACRTKGVAIYETNDGTSYRIFC